MDALREDHTRSSGRSDGVPDLPSSAGIDRALLAHVFLIVLGVIAVDQLSKSLAEALLPPGGISVRWMGATLSLSPLRNSAFLTVAFPQARLAGILVAVLTMTFLIGRLAELLGSEVDPPVLVVRGMALVLGGVVGNALDRVRLGAVVDFISAGGKIVFNLADSAILAGTLALLAFVVTADADRPEGQ